jgi:hypothetical protein
VWAREPWLDLLARFVHLEQPEPGQRSRAARAQGQPIFPRFHQWHAVRTLAAHAREHGAGHRYLVQHSAGSGKSNTIAWLAHRLSSLHDAEDRKVFDKVIVITDRRVLDRQLQDTIFQFEHAHGVVAKIDTDSAQLADALAGAEVITTLQKVPFVVDQVGDLAGSRFAVLIDEAHSSQGGESATTMTAVLRGPAAAPAPDTPVPDAPDIEGEANSRVGGALLVGVDDVGGVVGLDHDFASLAKEGHADRDRFRLHLTQLLVNAVGEAATSQVIVAIESIDGHDVARLHVEPSAFPVIQEVKGVPTLWVRLDAGTRAVTDPAEIDRYIATRWPSG